MGRRVVPVCVPSCLGVSQHVCVRVCVPRARGRGVSSTIGPLMEADAIDVILEVTGAVDFGARVAMEAFAHKKHVIAMNAELDGTIGPILKVTVTRWDWAGSHTH